MPDPTPDEIEALAALIDKALDGDCGRGVGASLARTILADGYIKRDPYDDYCPTCDAPEPWHTATCAVVHLRADEWEWMVRSSYAPLDRTWDSGWMDEATARAIVTDPAVEGIVMTLYRRAPAGPWEEVVPDGKLRPQPHRHALVSGNGGRVNHPRLGCCTKGVHR